MPGLVRKFLIIAAAEGLLLQPVTRGTQSPSGHSIRIDYKTAAISPSLRQDSQDLSNGEGLEAHGIIGLLNLASASYLISISGREQVAQIRGKPIYVVTDVALIPLSSRADAQTAISSARHAIKHGKQDTLDDVDTDSEDEGASKTSAIEDEEDDASVASTPFEESKSATLRRTGTVVSDVLQKKGSYGRFANKWFSKDGWKSEGRRKQGMSSSSENLGTEQEQPDEASYVRIDTVHGSTTTTTSQIPDAAAKDVSTPTPSSLDTIMTNLTPRILSTTKFYLSSRSFFFSYDLDISRSLSRQESQNTSVPLHKRFDPLYFWNRKLAEPITTSGQNAFVLPLIQGFVGQRSFTIAPTKDNAPDKIIDATEAAKESVELQETTLDEPKSEKANTSHDFLLTLISRRSVKRAGLRYLRRGIDDQGNVANAVETEQILSTAAGDPSDKTFSFVQIRGSIPLFFSQSPYAFKPVPTMHGSEAINQTAFKKHFENVLARYGSVYCTSLVDKHANELKIGESYETYASNFNAQGGVSGKKIDFEWFDFHGVCKGMKFENVSILMNTLSPFMEEHKWTTQQNNQIIQTQTGVLRVNCMDCLDRTNVVQSASAAQTLQKQLEELGLAINLSTDPKTSWFNTLWADNGDAISKQYAGTAALKGDFTRTRKRNWTGALSDFSLTLNRYYNNIFGDYFLQTCISYYLGDAGLSIFEHFETDMMTRDPSFDVSKVREAAIDTCTRIVLEDPETEDFFAGWTLSCPSVPDTLRSLPFEECILLLTDKALYFCRFDWSTEKVGSFERVGLEEIEGVRYGAYITSTLGPSHMNERENVGFVVRYRPTEKAMVRTNTRSLANEKSVEEADEVHVEEVALQAEEVAAPPAVEKTAETTKMEKTIKKKDETGSTRILAFKALPPASSARKEEDDTKDGGDMLSIDLVKHICHEIARLATAAAEKEAESAAGGDTTDDMDKGWAVERQDVISLAEAKRSTGYLESLGYSLKKLVWA